MVFQYSKVLVIGATSGIGEALAERIAQNGSFVIVTGRRQEKLDQFVSKHGKDKAEAIQFDITKLDQIPKFVKDVMKTHPDIDRYRSSPNTGKACLRYKTDDFQQYLLELWYPKGPRL